MKKTAEKKVWKTSQREILYSDKTIVMAILNITPDSFSDGGKYTQIRDALKQAEKLIAEGADILDIGGESTRPNSKRVEIENEIKRVCPVIGEIKKRFDIPVSIDTNKSEVAEKALDSGAEIVNDISGLRFDEKIGEVVFKKNAGIVLMHLRGEFETMHGQKPVENIFKEVSNGFNWSIEKAKCFGINEQQICLDVGIGFSKTIEQNLELLAKLDKLCQEFLNFPLLVGTSRKSFIGKILKDAPTDQRLSGTIATNAICVWNGANIVRVHDVEETVEALKVVEEIKKNL